MRTVRKQAAVSSWEERLHQPATLWTDSCLGLEPPELGEVPSLLLQPLGRVFRDSGLGGHIKGTCGGETVFTLYGCPFCWAFLVLVSWQL